MKNALQASLHEEYTTRLLLRAYCVQEEQIFIEVIDNGPGISKEVEEQIFVPFFTTKSTGTGVGLSIARQIMRLHQGSLSLKRSKPGETVFILVFP